MNSRSNVENVSPVVESMWLRQRRKGGGSFEENKPLATRKKKLHDRKNMETVARVRRSSVQGGGRGEEFDSGVIEKSSGDINQSERV